MIYKVEKPLYQFKFWGGAKERAEKLSRKQFDIIEANFEDISDDWDDGKINDFFWFEFDMICEWLGYSDEDDFDEAVDKEK